MNSKLANVGNASERECFFALDLRRHAPRVVSDTDPDRFFDLASAIGEPKSRFLSFSPLLRAASRSKLRGRPVTILSNDSGSDIAPLEEVGDSFCPTSLSPSEPDFVSE